MKKLNLMLAMGIACAMPALADVTYYVSPDGSDLNDGLSEATAFRSITKAIGKLEDNTPATIVLEKDATFDVGGPEALVVGTNKSVVFQGENTTLKSGDKPYLGDRIATVGTGSDARFEGLVFLNGCTRDGIPGGAIFFEGNTLEIDRCTFSQNEANNSGGAIASRGKDVIITNSVFDSNRVFSGYGCGAVIYQCGLPNAAKEKCSLVIRNTSFTNNESKNDTKGDLIGFMHYYRNSEYTHEYSNVTYFEMTNCLVKDNVAGDPSTSVRPRPSDICVLNVRDDFEMNLVNNTFYNTKTLAFQSFFDTPWRLVNNVFYNKNTFNIISEHDSDERDPLIAYNNVFVGDFAENLHIDDECLTSKRDQYGNVVIPASDLSALGMANRVSKDGFYAYYMPIENENSILIDAGLSSTADLDDFTEELIPTTDICGTPVAGKKDVGCFEFNDGSGVKGVSANGGEKLFAMEANGDGVCFTNLKGGELTLRIMLVDGRTIYSAKVVDKVTVKRSDLEIPNGLLIINATAGNVNQTLKTILF